MSPRFNPPPSWPRPPAGWTPPPGWRPDPSWGPVPPGWQLWVGSPPPVGAPSPVPSPTGPVSRGNGDAMVAVAAASCGLAGFVPPLWAARQRPHDAAFRRRMHAVAAGLLALVVVGTVLAGAADEDSAGSPAGPLGDVGATLLLVNLVLSVTVAVMVRKADVRTALPGVAEELARRRLREQYRQLAKDDPSLARSLCLGRPDLGRTVDDGGLVDLNAIPADRLAPLAGLSAEEARRVADARREVGPFTCIDEVALYADLPDTTVTMLRERALFF